MLADPASLAGKVVRTERPDGGYDDEWPADQKVVGYQDPEWTGLAWAPLAPVLVQRKVWIVEAKPRDPYYLFDRIELARRSGDVPGRVEPEVRRAGRRCCGACSS